MPDFVRLSVLLSLFAVPGPALAQFSRGEIISETLARNHGLTRAWVARVRMDPQRERIVEVTLQGDALFAVTNQSTIHAFAAETGQTLWVAQIGKRNFVSTAVGASRKFVAIANGSTLYVINRADGRVLFERRVEGTPSAGPAVTDDMVYVPTFRGAIEAYSTTDPKKQPTIYRSRGGIQEPPVLAGESLIWATRAGYVYSAHLKDLAARFRFTTRGPVTAGMAALPPHVFAASSDGYLYAINEQTGSSDWQFSTGYPLREPPVALGGNVYVIPEFNGMFCLGADRGEQRWLARDVARFVAASRTRLYTADSVGRLLVLDAKSGAYLDTLPATQSLPLKVRNIDNDRLYLGTNTGLIQCLHEVEQAQPLVHASSGATAAAGAAAAAAGGETATGERAAAPAAAPAAAEAAEAGDDPFSP